MRAVYPKIFVAAFVLLLPMIASATHITSLAPDADCAGWTVDVTVRYRSTAFEADLVMEVLLTDEDFNVLETQNLDDHLVRAQSDYQTQMYSYAGDWTVFAPAGEYHMIITVSVEAPYPGGVDFQELTLDQMFLCNVVPTESNTWSAVKDLYR